jgi:hypothetical protein
MRQACCGCLTAHHSDRPPYPEANQQTVPVAASEHPVRPSRGDLFGFAPMRVHHQMRGAVDIDIRKHHLSLSIKNKIRAKYPPEKHK